MKLTNWASFINCANYKYIDYIFTIDSNWIEFASLYSALQLYERVRCAP